MGSGRRVDFLERMVLVGLMGMEAVMEEGWVERLRLRPRKISAVFRTCEKSCVESDLEMKQRLQ